MMIFMIKQAVILAGGMGTRLRPLTDKMPKPMVPVNGRPFLEYLIELLKNNGIKEIVLCTGYLHEKITEYFGDGLHLGVRIVYSVGDVSFETGKRLKNAENLLDERFLLLYCDNYWPLRLENLAEFYEISGSLAMMAVYSNKKGITKNNVRIEGNYVTKYDKSRAAGDLNAVDIGFFIFDKAVIDLVGNENCSFEERVFPVLVEKRQFSAFITDHKYYSISTVERMKDAEDFLRPKKVVFLDRDGVVNRKPEGADYVKNWGEFDFIPGVVESIKLLKEHGFKIIIITNQPGIARGVMTKEALDEIHRRMQAEVNNGIDAIYACIHGWDDGCECRKPKPGLLLDASDDFRIDLTKSYFVGDDKRDMIAGNAAGCRTILVGPENKDIAINDCTRCKDLFDAAHLILRECKI